MTGRGGGPSPGPTNKLFVRNLWRETEKETLQEIFPEANDVYLPKDRENWGEKRVRNCCIIIFLCYIYFILLCRFGFITFDDVATAKKALEYDGTEVDGF